MVVDIRCGQYPLLHTHAPCIKQDTEINGGLSSVIIQGHSVSSLQLN